MVAGTGEVRRAPYQLMTQDDRNRDVDEPGARRRPQAALARIEERRPRRYYLACIIDLHCCSFKDEEGLDFRCFNAYSYVHERRFRVVASPVEVAFDAAPSPAPALGLIPDLSRAERGAVYEVDDLGELDARLVALCRERGPLRAVAARIASALVLSRSWERLGFARLSDYAAERLGVSSRSVQSLARVGHRLRWSAPLEAALVSGELGWTRVRLLAQLPEGEAVGPWIGYARRVTTAQLAQSVRAVDGGSLEGGALEETPRSRRFSVRCTPQVRRKWHFACKAAARVAGHRLHVSEAAELIAAEVLSAVPLDDDVDGETCDDAGASWGAASEDTQEGQGEMGPRCLPWRARGEAESLRPVLPATLRSLLEDLDAADAFGLDERLRRVLSLEQRLEARLGPWLLRVWGRWVHRALGYATRDAYARERLGMDPTRARALVRLERVVAGHPGFARAYRSGALSWVKARVLAPLASDDAAPCIDAWVSWAGRVSVRRLRDDVEQALTLAETDPQAFRRTGGLPVDADREIRATHRDWEEDSPAGEPRAVAGAASGADRETGATHTEAPAGVRDHGPPKSAPDETCHALFIASPDVVQLLRAILCTVRRRLGREMGRLPTQGQAFEAMLDHALASWGALDGRIAARHKVFARDGWRCAAPGCSSMQNLHDHHIRFRSAGGSDDLANRVTLCAFHHLRGIHAGLVRCVGRAPDGLRWEMGLRPGREPLMAYRSGDVQTQPRGTA